ncbi:nucleic acid binding [Zea mays]|uniref:Survival of motor neuron-related-splicing factor 30 n=1 Tax=Zea mays TaxID=4577 RepID=A0A1D6PXC3_MAIZE|nr:nucleic acid binding [Zea mays]
MEDLSVEELASNLSTYKEQLREVKKLIKEKKDDAGISEYIDMEKELQEVITLTEEILATAKQTESAQNVAGLSPPSYSAGVQSEGLDDLSHSHKFAVGTRVQAVWSEDGEWYNATVEALTPNGYYVAYDGWGNSEEVCSFFLKVIYFSFKNRVGIFIQQLLQVDPDNVRLLEEEAADALGQAEKEAEATKMAIKRKIEQAATSDFQARSLPAKLRIEPSDPEDVKAAKRKKIHAFKSKSRFEQLEFAQNKRQNAWQQFQTKGKAKKVGFFSGRKKESIFKSPDDHRGKVGVTGSGKGLTDFQRREKHLHLKGGSGDAADDDEE